MDCSVRAVVEIPKGSKLKYEVDKESGALVVDRPLSNPIPYNYGYVVATLHADGDPLDICIIGSEPIYPLARLNVTLLGAFICTDNGVSDDKLVGYVSGEVATLGHLDLIDINFKRAEVEHYLSTYKAGFVVEKWVDADEAFKIFMRDIEAFKNE